MENSDIWYIVVLVLCFIFSAFFASSEIAYLTLPRHRLNILLEKGHNRAKTVEKLVSRTDKLLSTIVLGNNVTTILATAVATVLAVKLWGEGPGLAVATVLLTVLMLIFGEAAPKNIAAAHNERLALLYAPFLNFFSNIFVPITFILGGIVNLISKIFGADKQRHCVSEEDILSMVEEGSKDGDVEKQEAEMIHNIFDFTDRPVSEILLPRPEIVGVEKGNTISQYLDIFKEHPVSRMPIFEENMDNILGFIANKDVLLGFAKETLKGETLVEHLLRPVYFIPETKKVGQLFHEMLEKHYQFCVVVDEYGGTAGIVSFSMIIQEIVGPLGDEHIRDDDEIQALKPNTYQVDAGMNVAELNEAASIDIPEDEGYETIAGFILSYLGNIPTQGQIVRYQNLRIVITKMKGAKIEEVIISIEPKVEENEQKD